MVNFYRGKGDALACVSYKGIKPAGACNRVA